MREIPLYMPAHRRGSVRRIGLAVFMACSVAAILAVKTRAAGPQSFTFLQTGFTQQIWGVTNNLQDPSQVLLGGVAFTGNGNPLVAECLLVRTRLHQFLSQTQAAPDDSQLVHGETILTDSNPLGLGGCGIVNHPDGHIYANVDGGNSTNTPLVQLNGTTGAFIQAIAAVGPGGVPTRGGGLGLAVDPTNNHIIYVANDCEQGQTPPSLTCTLVDLDPSILVPSAQTPNAHVLGYVTTTDTTNGVFVDGIYFDPTGGFLFLSGRAPTNNLIVMQLSGTGAARTASVLTLVPMGNATPDGVAFHASTPQFVVTNNNNTDPNDNATGTMTRFDFPINSATQLPDYSQQPQLSVFASGGFRGDLTAVGADGCIYATQRGVRYDDGSPPVNFTDNSLVQICGGFAPPPGVGGGGAQCTGTIGDFVWNDLNGDGLQSSGEPGIAGVTVTLESADGTTVLKTTTTDTNGIYHFNNQCAGTYQVIATTPTGYAPTTSLVGSDRTIDSNGSPTTVTLTASNTVDNSIDFGFVLGSLAGKVFADVNGNGVFDGTDYGISGVTITLNGGSGMTVSDVNGNYKFMSLAAGTYTLAAPTTTNGLQNETVGQLTNPLNPTLAAGQNLGNQNFAYIPGSLSGIAYVDANKNGKYDTGEQLLGNVPIALAGPTAGTGTTAANGTYSFSGLAGGSYVVSAASPADGFSLETAPSINVSLSPGGSAPNNNFGYIPGGLSGVVFEDLNGNRVRDAGEPGIGGVTVTLVTTGATTTSAGDGSYSFGGLASGSYQVSSPSTASGFALDSASPLSATLAAGQSLSGLNFGYVPGSITGYVYEDFNKNKQKDSNEPGIGGVVVTLSGTSGATTTTAANGSYSFKGLKAGTYSVISPATAAGLSLETTSPFLVTIAAGQTKHADFGYIGSGLPTCTEQAYAGPPFWGTMSFQGVSGGIVSLTITSSVNFSATMTGHSGTIVPPVPPTYTSTFSPPSTSPVVVTATLMDQTKGGEITASATDVFGNTVTCDPIAMTLTELRHEKGNQVLDDIPAADHIVTIENHNPGLDALDVVVNGVEFRVRGVPDNGTRVLDIGRAMRPGSENRIVLIPRGTPGDSATIVISDHGPS